METTGTGHGRGDLPPISRSGRRRGWRWGVGLAVALLCGWLVVRDLDWPALVAHFSSVNAWWVLLGAAAIISTFFTRSWRWQVLLGSKRAPTPPTMTALLVGQVVNSALPMRSGDVARAAWIASRGRTGVLEALGSIAVEKVWDLVALLACCILLFMLMPLPSWFVHSIWGIALVFCLAALLLWAVVRWRLRLLRLASLFLARLPARWAGALIPRFERAADGLESIRRPDVSARVGLWTLLNWGLGAVANWSVLAAFGIPSVTAAIFLLAALMIGAAVPVPGQLGVFEGICVVSLSLFDVPWEQALAAGLVLHAVVMVPPLLVAPVLAVGLLREAR